MVLICDAFARRSGQVSGGAPVTTTPYRHDHEAHAVTAFDIVNVNGVDLAYAEAGSGDPPILLVHGMRCDHSHMQPVFDHLAQAHRVVSVDLRGHGRSAKPDGPYTNEAMAADLVGLCEHLGLDRPIGIGHSFGGSLLLWLTVERPDLLRALVVLDSGVRSNEERLAELGVIVREDTAQSDDDLRAFLENRLFGPDDPQWLKAEVLELMFTSVPPHAAAAMGRTVVEFDAADAAERCTIPALFLLADRPFTSNAVLERLGPNWRIGRVVGAGHFVQLVAPAQVNAMIDRFLELLA
jgi:pimeloyl-ACP methyl ester carboxylesterase